MDLVLNDGEMLELESVFMQYVEDCDSSYDAKNMVDNLWNKISRARRSPDDGYSVTFRWHVADVQTVRPDLDEKKCAEVLDYVKRYHDASLGISWGNIEAACDAVYPF
jgi:hypothetical protein